MNINKKMNESDKTLNGKNSKGLEKKFTIAQQYREAAADKERNKEACEWDVCIADGLDETNEF